MCCFVSCCLLWSPILPGGTKVYTPFPEYEETVPPSGATTQRSSYFLAGQMVAVRVRTGTTGSGALSFAYADHPGSLSAWTTSSGAYIGGSLIRHEPYGNYRTAPGASVNPGISDRGFTGHRHNNTGSNDIGLIYMNVRYYMPGIGRFRATGVASGPIRSCRNRATRRATTDITTTAKTRPPLPAPDR